MRRTLRKDKTLHPGKWREDNTEEEKEEVEEEGGNPNRLSARQELPFLTLPSA